MGEILNKQAGMGSLEGIMGEKNIYFSPLIFSTKTCKGNNHYRREGWGIQTPPNPLDQDATVRFLQRPAILSFPGKGR